MCVHKSCRCCQGCCHSHTTGSEFHLALQEHGLINVTQLYLRPVCHSAAPLSPLCVCSPKIQPMAFHAEFLSFCLPCPLSVSLFLIPFLRRRLWARGRGTDGPLQVRVFRCGSALRCEYLYAAQPLYLDLNWRS